MHPRIVTPEWMDRDNVPLDELQRSLAFIRRVNRYLCGTRAVISHLRKFSLRWPPGRPITILDVATGSGDIPLAIARWARRARHDVRVTALDRHALTLELAARHVRGEPQVTLVRADALEPPFAPGTFDYVVSSLFLHHLSDERVVDALEMMRRLARRGVIWNDLLRHRRAGWWCRLLTAASTPIVKHDAVASIRAGFLRHEVESLRDRLRLGHLRFHRHVGHRFTLAGEVAD